MVQVGSVSLQPRPRRYRFKGCCLLTTSLFFFFVFSEFWHSYFFSSPNSQTKVHQQSIGISINMFRAIRPASALYRNAAVAATTAARTTPIRHSFALNFARSYASAGLNRADIEKRV